LLFVFIIPPLIEWGLYCNHLVRPFVHIFVTDISASTGRKILYLIYGFGMVTCTVSPLSRFTAHLLPVYRATYKWTSGGILSTTLHATSCLVCENGFLRAISHQRWSLRCEIRWEVHFEQINSINVKVTSVMSIKH
jgi:hypothetical protein